MTSCLDLLQINRHFPIGSSTFWGNLLGTNPRLEEGEDDLEDFEDDGQDDEPRDLQTNANLSAIPRERYRYPFQFIKIDVLSVISTSPTPKKKGRITVYIICINHTKIDGL